MANKFDLVLKGAEVFIQKESENFGRLVKTDLGIRAGKIIKIEASIQDEADQVEDLTGLTILPGLIDTQVHFREPGLEHKEDLETGMRAAALGGLTGVFEMPNTSPPTTTEERLLDKLSRASQQPSCDYAFYVGGSPENIEDLPALQQLPGVCGVKVFMGSSTGNLLVNRLEDLERVIQNLNRRAAFHAEDEDDLKSRKHMVLDQPGRVELHPEWRSVETALKATRKVVELAKKYNKPFLHVLHISTAEEIEFLSTQKQWVSCEITPQHLWLHSPECYQELGTLAQMNPPIREKRHSEALWKAVQNNQFDIMGSDHAPHTFEEKQNIYPNSPSGMPGVQTMVPLMLKGVSEGKLRLDQMVNLLASNPARLFRIKKRGFIQEDFEATFTVVDLNLRRTIEESWLASKVGWSPFTGWEVTGWPVQTWLRGEPVMVDGQVLKRTGRPFEFEAMSS